MVLTLDRIPSIGYDLESFGRETITYDGSKSTRLRVTTAETENPGYLRQKFAINVQQVLEITDPQFTYGIVSAAGRLFVFGYAMVYDEETEGSISKVRKKVAVISGKNQSREVAIHPTIGSDGFLDTYERILERDLVSNGKII